MPLLVEVMTCRLFDKTMAWNNGDLLWTRVPGTNAIRIDWCFIKWIWKCLLQHGRQFPVPNVFTCVILHRATAHTAEHNAINCGTKVMLSGLYWSALLQLVWYWIPSILLRHSFPNEFDIFYDKVKQFMGNQWLARFALFRFKFWSWTQLTFVFRW